MSQYKLWSSMTDELKIKATMDDKNITLFVEKESEGLRVTLIVSREEDDMEELTKVKLLIKDED